MSLVMFSSHSIPSVLSYVIPSVFGTLTLNLICITGYNREEVVGRNCRFLQGPGTDPDTVREVKSSSNYNQRYLCWVLNVVIINGDIASSRFVKPWKQKSPAPCEFSTTGTASHFSSRSLMFQHSRSMECFNSKVEWVYNEVSMRCGAGRTARHFGTTYT